MISSRILNGAPARAVGCGVPPVVVFRRNMIHPTVKAPPADVPGLSGEEGTAEFFRLGGFERRTDLTKALRKKFGEIVRIDLPHLWRSVILFDPDDIRTVYSKEGKYPLGTAQLVSTVITEAAPEVGLPKENISNMVGPEWKTTRTLLQKDITPPPIAQSYLPLLAPTIDRLTDNIHLLNFDEGPIIISLDMFHTVLFGKEMGWFNAPLQENSWYPFVMEGKYFLFYITKYLNSPESERAVWKEKAEKLMSKILVPAKNATFSALEENAKWAEAPVKPYIHRLWDRGPESQREITKGGSVPGLIIAALDTTANALELLLGNLATNPEPRNKLHDELSSLLKGGPLMEEHLRKIPYLRACIKETFRLNNPIPGSGRVLESDVTIRGYNIPAGTLIETSGHPWCTDEAIFPDANKYIPDRWLEEQDEIRNHPYLILTFGIGPRMCLGARVAETEIMAYTASLIQKYDFTSPPSNALISTPFIRFNPRPSLTYTPRHSQHEIVINN